MNNFLAARDLCNGFRVKTGATVIDHRTDKTYTLRNLKRANLNGDGGFVTVRELDGEVNARNLNLHIEIRETV